MRLEESIYTGEEECGVGPTFILGWVGVSGLYRAPGRLNSDQTDLHLYRCAGRAMTLAGEMDRERTPVPSCSWPTATATIVVIGTCVRFNIVATSAETNVNPKAYRARVSLRLHNNTT